MIIRVVMTVTILSVFIDFIRCFIMFFIFEPVMNGRRIMTMVVE